MNGCFRQHRKSRLYKDIVADAPNPNEHVWMKFSPQLLGGERMRTNQELWCSCHHHLCLFKETIDAFWQKHWCVFTGGGDVIIIRLINCNQYCVCVCVCESNFVLVYWLSDLINVSSRAPCCFVHEISSTHTHKLTSYVRYSRGPAAFNGPAVIHR